MHEESIGLGSSPATEGVEQAKRIGRSARDRVLSTVDGGKERLVAQLEEWLGKADALKNIGPAEGFVTRANDIVQSLKTRSTSEILDDVQAEARRRPAAFMLGALAVGFIAARALKDVANDSGGFRDERT